MRRVIRAERSTHARRLSPAHSGSEILPSKLESDMAVKGQNKVFGPNNVDGNYNIFGLM